MKKTILPGSTIGILGSGQLGRMLAQAARTMGYRVHTYSPEKDTPTGQIADREFSAAYEDAKALREFAESVDVVTFEFENVPWSAIQAVEKIRPVRPRGEVLHTTQHRRREKEFLAGKKIPVTPFAVIASAGEIDAAVKKVGLPAVLKTAGFGYDGKGQRKVATRAELEAAYAALGGETVLEAFVDFAKEISVVAARGADGSFVHWGAIENQHAHHILDVSISPARVSAKVADEAARIARTVLEALDVVGVLCVEFFLTKKDELLVNELAPRPHNSGHLTIEGSVTSQFAQQLRAVCGLPLGSTEWLRPAAMVNLLGDVWEKGEPDWAKACAVEGATVHLYGKREARPGRKMGHITAVAADSETAVQRARAARDAAKAK